MLSREAFADRVFIRDLCFEANHGYTAKERQSKRTFRVNIELSADLKRAGESDDLGDTLDYWKVCDIAHTIGTTKTFKLMEALAGEICDAIQALYPKADLSLQIEKLEAPCPGKPESCGIRITRPAPASHRPNAAKKSVVISETT